MAAVFPKLVSLTLISQLTHAPVASTHEPLVFSSSKPFPPLCQAAIQYFKENWACVLLMENFFSLNFFPFLPFNHCCSSVGPILFLRLEGRGEGEATKLSLAGEKKGWGYTYFSKF